MISSCSVVLHYSLILFTIFQEEKCSESGILVTSPHVLLMGLVDWHMVYSEEGTDHLLESCKICCVLEMVKIFLTVSKSVLQKVQFRYYR